MKFHNYCLNRDVFTGKYDCNMLEVVNNLAICTGKECNHCGNMENHFLGESDRERFFKLHSGSVYGNTVFRIILGEDIRYLSDETFPF